MRIITSLLLAALTTVCSCGHRGEPRFLTGAGDAGPFILRHAVARGGQPITTNGLPTIPGPWRYSEDQYGVIIRLPRRDYDAVEALLRQAFGAPTFGPTDTIDGGKLGGYRLTPKGGVIQFGYDADTTQITVVRPLTKREVVQGVGRAVMEKGESR